MITPFMSGHKVRLLTDTAHARTPEDDIFCQVDRLLDEARDIRIEMYSLDQPDIVDKLIARARQGVPVEIVVDPPRQDIRDVAKAEAMGRLSAAGAIVRLSPLRRSNQRDHVKLLVVDGCKAIIGGMNWGGHSPQNHDYDLLVEGPVVADMLGPFNLHAPVPAPVGDTSVRLLTSDLNERSIEQAVHQAIDGARRSIHVEQFVLTERGTIDRLKQARARGVDVRVILHPMKIGEKAINEAAASDLRSVGIPVRWHRWDPARLDKLHAEVGVFDGEDVIIGSANWSRQGFTTNREADVEVLSREVASALEEHFQADWNRSTPVPVYPPEGPPLAGPEKPPS